MNTIDTLAEKYLDRLHAGEDPALEPFDAHVAPHLREALRRRLRFVYLMYCARPRPGEEGA